METDRISLYKNFLDEVDCGTTLYMLKDSGYMKWYDELLNSVTGNMDKINRKMAYVSDDPDFVYKYAKYSFPGQTWDISHLADIQCMVNTLTGRSFNSVLLNWYKDGRDTINYHADKEDILKGGIEGSVIACVNLGATRNFWFRKINSDEKPFSYSVSNGDLLVMNAGCQSEYLHAILKEPNVTEPRISLTFREV